jgi:thiol-disulfide isomerase/thioredoxin
MLCPIVMTDHRNFRRALLVAAFLLAGACTKKAAQPSASEAAPGSRPSVPSGASAANVDLSKLSDSQRKVYDQVVNREPSACGKGHSLLHSLKNDPGCRASFYAARYVTRLAGEGSSEEEISDRLRERFRSPRVNVDLSRAPSKGAESGRVKLVEFADYECGHCKEAAGMMPALLAEYPKDLTVYFKHFPLGGHVGSVNAALAAASAQKHGKFWPFNDRIWENFDRLTPALLESIAKEIPGLEFDQWYADLKADEIRAHVIDDRGEGRNLQIHKTPAIYINGRLFTEEPTLAGLKDWIDEELGR